MNDITNPVLRKIWEDRYQKNGETLEDNYRRVANYIAQNDEEAEMFFQIMSEGLFVPAGRTMSNCGVGENLTLNNCFVAPQVPDDLKSIFNTVKLGAVTHKAGGGIGYDFSLLRPAGTSTSNDAIASGPVSFMEVFNTQTSTILQGNRRGANMGVMNVYHPDITKFITAKAEAGRFEHFNLSVMVDDAFMNAVQNDEEVTLHYPVYDSTGKILNDRKQWTHETTIKAKELWDQIMQLAYDNGEPGIFFYDNMNKDNNLWYTENIVCSNPCSEYLAGTVYGVDNPQEYGGACNLGSLILPNFVENPFMHNAQIDTMKLASAVACAVRMLDNIIDVNKFPDKIYENYQKRFRTIGLGVTGISDMLAMLNLKYSSQEARDFVDEFMSNIARHAYNASVSLAIEKGQFPGFEQDLTESGYLNKHHSEPAWRDTITSIHQHGLRNARIMSIAPCGTMSLTFGNNCSSGIEPIFALEYDRKIKMGGQSEEHAQIVKVRDYAYDLWLQVKDDPRCIVTEDVFETALDLDVNAHIDMLAVIAKHVDMSVSKTINIPTEYSFDDTKDVYIKCWQLGIKGCTIFRPNAIRQGILITNNNAQPTPTVDATNLKRGDVIAADDNVIGLKRKLTTGCGTLHCTAFFDPITGDLLETYLSKGSTGGCLNSLTGLSRMISLSARAGVDIQTIVDQLDSTGSCPSYAVRTATKRDTSKGACCPMAVGRAIMDMYNEMQATIEGAELPEMNSKTLAKVTTNHTDNTKKAQCPTCGADLIFEGGCVQCKECGWSKCE